MKTRRMTTETTGVETKQKSNDVRLKVDVAGNEVALATASGQRVLVRSHHLFLEGEAVTGGVQDPGVVVGALHARVQPECLSRQLPRVEWARIWQ